ncbi:MAG: AlpA family phage regulatory protein [Holophagales bacterium]|jgi:predicted DNA-binding transcriptional regulator AlpA|nr:AlpA family phage regulatory protein [Holophagales bacterium]
MDTMFEHLNEKEVLKIVPFKKTTLWDRVGQWLFPRPIKFGDGTTRWLKSEIEEWFRAHQAGWDKNQIRALILWLFENREKPACAGEIGALVLRMGLEKKPDEITDGAFNKLQRRSRGGRSPQMHPSLSSSGSPDSFAGPEPPASYGQAKIMLRYIDPVLAKARRSAHTQIIFLRLSKQYFGVQNICGCKRP